MNGAIQSIVLFAIAFYPCVVNADEYTNLDPNYKLTVPVREVWPTVDGWPSVASTAQSSADSFCRYWGWDTGTVALQGGGWWANMTCVSSRGVESSGFIWKSGMCADGADDIQFPIPGLEAIRTTMACHPRRDLHKCIGKCCVSVGDPFDAVTGNSHQTERDFQHPTSPRLAFTRYYNSQSGVQPRAGFWTDSTGYRIVVAQPLGLVQVLRPNGDLFSFMPSASGYVADADMNIKLENISPANEYAWKLTLMDGSMEFYDASGNINVIKYSDGGALRFLYSTLDTPASIAPRTGLLIGMYDEFGRSLRFDYSAASILDAVYSEMGKEVAFEYDGPDSMISKVIYRDSSYRKYLYDESDNVTPASPKHLLTGILDENGSRVSSWMFDANGLTLSSTSGSLLTVAVDRRSGSPTVTEANGSTSSIAINDILAIPKVLRRSQPAGSGCSASVSSQDFDGPLGRSR